MSHIELEPLENNPRLEAIVIDVMSTFKSHNPNLGEVMDVAVHIVAGAIIQYPEAVRSKLIDEVHKILKANTTEESKVVDYTDKIKANVQ